MTSLAPAKLRQFSRITISVEEVAEAQILSSSNETLSRFDIIAACPANSKVLGYLCRQGDIDIISLDFTHRLQFPLNKKMV
jgi:ribonuclease P/MRP protein subunit RPP1